MGLNGFSQFPQFCFCNPNNFSKSFLGETNTDAETPYIEENKDKQYSLPFDPDPEAEWINVSNIVEGNDKIIEVLNYLDHEKKNDAKVAIDQLELIAETRSHRAWLLTSD